MKILPDTADWLTAERALEWEIDWILSAHHKRHLEFLLPRIKQYGIQNVLEFGCGAGLLALGLPDQINYQGIDKYEAYLPKASARYPRGAFDPCDLRDYNPRQLPSLDCLVIAFNFLKNFGLYEWDSILAKILATGCYAAFNVQTFKHDLDDGTEYHHVFVTAGHLDRAVKAAGHEIVEQVELSAWEKDDEMARDMAVWTQRN